MKRRIFLVPNDKGSLEIDYDNFIGSYFTKEMSSMMSMLSIIQRKSRSFLLREIVDQYLRRNSYSSEVLINSVAERAYRMWEINYKVIGKEKSSMKAFKVELRSDLESRKITEDFVNQILNKLDEFQEEDK